MSLAPALLKDADEFERLCKSFPDAAILRRPAGIHAQIIREQQIVENDGEVNLLAKLAPTVAALKGAGVKDLKRAASNLMERIASGNLDGLSASEARHAAEKIAALSVIKGFHADSVSGKEIDASQLRALEKALDRFGIDAGDDMRPDEFAASRLSKEIAAVSRELNGYALALNGMELKAAKGIIRSLKADALMQAQSDWQNDILHESYNDSLDLETEQTVTLRIPKANLGGILHDSPSLSEKGEDGDMAILEASYLIPDRNALAGDGVDDEMEEQYYGADAIRAMDMPISQIEREAKSVFSVANPFMPEPSFIAALEESESLEEFQERHDFEDHEPGVAPTFIHFDERERNSPHPRMHR